MAFVAPTGLEREISDKTQDQLESTLTMFGLVDMSDQGRFEAGEERFTMQKRTYGAGTSNVARSKTKAGQQGSNPEWPDAEDASSGEIVVALKPHVAASRNIPHLDAKQSPLNEVETTRQVLEYDIAKALDQQIASYFTRLATSGNDAVNDGAGPVSAAVFGDAGNDYIAVDSTEKNPEGSRPIMRRVVNDLVLHAKRNNWIDGVALQGDIPSTIYMVMHAELFLNNLAQPMADAGYSLDPLTADVLQRSAIFSGEAFTARLAQQKITIVCPNVLQVPAADQPWEFWAGYTEAVVGGIGDMVSQVLSPEMNQGGIGWLVRQAAAPYYQLRANTGVRRYSVVSDTSA